MDQESGDGRGIIEICGSESEGVGAFEEGAACDRFLVAVVEVVPSIV